MDEIKHKFRDFLDKHQVNIHIIATYQVTAHKLIALSNLFAIESQYENSIDGIHGQLHKEEIVIDNKWII